jgi:hypothetical protein
MKYMLFPITMAALAISTAAGVDADAQKQVFGSAFLEPYNEPGQEIRDAVKLRYKCQVVENQCARPEMWKIIFMFHFLHAPGNTTPYELQTNLYTWRFAYPHLSKRKATGDVQGLRNLPGQSSLFLSVPDNHKNKKIGARSLSPDMFPTLDQEIDGFKDLWKREQVSQVNVTGKQLSIEIARQELVEDLQGWSVHGDLPLTRYRRWRTTATWDGVSYKVDFVLPDESAQYFVPSRMTQIATEAFSLHPGLFEAFFWDIEIQRENQVAWEPVSKWKLVESDAKPDANTWGMKRSTFADRPAIEVSNDGTKTYAKKGDILELK